jgi:uncharacterized membrane protein YgcG
MVVDNPNIFHSEARLIVASRRAQDVLLYIENNKLYEAVPCSEILCCNSSQRLSNIEVVTGTVTILDYTGRQTVKVHNINLGLKVKVLFWFGSGIKIYDTPDAAELARRLNPGTTTVPTRMNLTLREPPPSNGGGGGGGFGGGYGGGCGGGGGGAGGCH